MKKILPLLIWAICLFSCEESTSDVQFANGPVNADLPFLVVYIPCQDTQDSACVTIPIEDATIQLFKVEEGVEAPRFVAEGKTNEEGRLIICYVPLGSYNVEVSTNDYGDKTVRTESFLGRMSEDRIKFP